MLYSLNEITRTWVNHEWLSKRQAFFYLLAFVVVLYKFVNGLCLAMVDWKGYESIPEVLRSVEGFYAIFITFGAVVPTVVTHFALRRVTAKTYLQYSFFIGGICSLLAFFCTNVLAFEILVMISNFDILSGMWLLMGVLLDERNDIWASRLSFWHFPITCAGCVYAIPPYVVLHFPWKMAFVAESVVILLYCILTAMIIESPRDLMRLNRMKDAVEALRTFAEKTGNELPKDFEGLDKEKQEEEEAEQERQKEQKRQHKGYVKVKEPLLPQV